MRLSFRRFRRPAVLLLVACATLLGCKDLPTAPQLNQEPEPLLHQESPQGLSQDLPLQLMLQHHPFDTADLKAVPEDSVDMAIAAGRASNRTTLVSPETHTFNALEEALSFTATVRDKRGRPLSTSKVSWTSLNPQVATVDAFGQVVSRGIGIALIVASSGGSADTATVRVQQVVAAISVSPASSTLAVGDAVVLQAEARDANGFPLSDPGQQYMWLSSAPDVASVDAGGRVQGRASGLASITAASGGHDATALVEVLAAPVSGTTAQAADAFVGSIGVNVHISYLDRVYGSDFYTIIKPKLAELGVRHLRDKGMVTPWDSWMKKIYGRMEELAALGMRFTLINQPAHNVTDFTTAQHLDRLFAYLSPSSVVAFEGINEHDFSGRPSWAQEIRTFQEALYRKIKGDPRVAHLPVLGPSLARPRNSADVGDLTPYMDYGVMHPYSGGEVPMKKTDYHVRELLPMNGIRRLWVTEAGYHTAPAYQGGHPGVSEVAMGKYIPRLFLDYFKAGYARTFSYELIDEGTDPADKEDYFGLLRIDGSEKPAFTALKHMIALLTDPGPAFVPGALAYDLDGDLDGIAQLLLQKRDGRFYLILWQDAACYDVAAKRDLNVPDRLLSLRLGLPAREVRTYLPLHSGAPVANAFAVSTLELRVPDHPLIVEILP